MEEEAEDRDSRESFLSSNFGLTRNVKSKKSGSATEDSNDGQDSGSSKSVTESDVNHLNALANLDPTSRYGENASLIKDIRLAANAAAEEEINKVYMCHLCDFKTAYANSLMNHQAVHSDFRPWVCTACEYAAKRKQDLKKHLHTVHGMMVESPMLKPLVPGGPGSKYAGSIDSMKDHIGEVHNLKRLSSSDQDFSAGQPSSPLTGYPAGKRIKSDVSSGFSTPQATDLTSNKLSTSLNEELDSPDDNLPVSFPVLSSSSSAKLSEELPSSENPSIPKFLPGKEEGEIVFNGAHPTFSWHVGRRDRYADSSHVNIPRDWASHPIKKETETYGSKENSDQYLSANKISLLHRRDNSFPRSLSLSDEDVSKDRAGVAETERSISSSSVVGHVRSTQTPSGFLCEHCDIMFFQRAMYVMHIGLHAPDNPWCCAVCGHTFSEKYSFTSHFINQH